MKIYSRWDGSKVIFENDGATMRETVLSAVSSGADLSSANLSGADLSGADLRGANLRGADLSSANLSGADLSGANLRGANLRIANLSGANLSSANLSGADLSGADLRIANLRGANLRGANLRGADLRHIKQDIWDILLRAPGEISGLLAALRAGRVDGSAYEGECVCLVGTIANVASKNYEALDLIMPNSSRPAERWFLAIRKGDTPETSSVSKLTVEWIEEFEQLLERAIAIRTTPVLA